MQNATQMPNDAIYIYIYIYRLNPHNLPFFDPAASVTASWSVRPGKVACTQSTQVASERRTVQKIGFVCPENGQGGFVGHF